MEGKAMRSRYLILALGLLLGAICGAIYGYIVGGRASRPLPEPIPPGSYPLRVFLGGTDLGPKVPDRPVITILDIGGWVGTSEAFNAVTLTVLPPE